MYCSRCPTPLVCKAHCSSPHLIKALLPRPKIFSEQQNVIFNIVPLNTLKSAGLKFCCEDIALCKSAVVLSPSVILSHL